MSKSVLILYPNQLFAVEFLPKEVDQIVLVEDPLMFGTDKTYEMFFHKQKLVLHRATMRRYVKEALWPAGYEVEYVEFHELSDSSDIVNHIAHAENVFHFDLVDDVLQRRLQTTVEGLAHKPQINQLESPNFFLTHDEVKTFFKDKKKAQFTPFYQWQRERFNILMNKSTYKPLGGKLSFDTENRKRLPKDHKLPTFQVYGANEYVEEAKQYVQKNFSDNPGSIENFPWPTNYHEASAWLDQFLAHRLSNFGPYEDAIDGEAPWVYHSALSPIINIGLLSPVEVVHRAVEYFEKHDDVPLASIEGFVRQILGWREYMRGMYVDRHVQLRSSNSFGHNRRLTNDWYYGTTGIPPVDDVIKKTLDRGYAHHIERLMIMGNIMFLCDFHPDEVYRWFMEMYIDAYDWVMVPNVYGMSQYSDGGSMVTKPYVSSSNYILKMSHYKKDDWCDIWDGLYWRFIEKNKEKLTHNPRMKIVINQLDRMSEDRRRVIGYRAEDFLNNKTQN